MFGIWIISRMIIVIHKNTGVTSVNALKISWWVGSILTVMERWRKEGVGYLLAGRLCSDIKRGRHRDESEFPSFSKRNWWSRSASLSDRFPCVGMWKVRATNATQTRSTQVPVQRVKIAQPSSLAVFPLPSLLILNVYGLFVAKLGRLVVPYIRVLVCI